jgi:streptogramin lyase
MDRATHREIVGRDDELATLHAFLGELTTAPGALVLNGEPGVGKTVGPVGARPHALAFSDGAAWVVEQSANAVARIGASH